MQCPGPGPWTCLSWLCPVPARRAIHSPRFGSLDSPSLAPPGPLTLNLRFPCQSCPWTYLSWSCLVPVLKGPGSLPLPDPSPWIHLAWRCALPGPGPWTPLSWPCSVPRVRRARSLPGPLVSGLTLLDLGHCHVVVPGLTFLDPARSLARRPGPWTYPSWPWPLPRGGPWTYLSWPCSVPVLAEPDPLPGALVPGLTFLDPARSLCSQSQIPCQVPKLSFPSDTGTVRLDPRKHAFTCAG